MLFMYKLPGDMSVTSRAVLIYETNNFCKQYLAALLNTCINNKEKHAIKIAVIKSGTGSNPIRSEVNFIMKNSVSNDCFVLVFLKMTDQGSKRQEHNTHRQCV